MVDIRFSSLYIWSWVLTQEYTAGETANTVADRDVVGQVVRIAPVALDALAEGLVQERRELGAVGQHVDVLQQPLAEDAHPARDTM